MNVNRIPLENVLDAYAKTMIEPAAEDWDTCPLGVLTRATLGTTNVGIETFAVLLEEAGEADAEQFVASTFGLLLDYVIGFVAAVDAHEDGAARVTKEDSEAYQLGKADGERAIAVVMALYERAGGAHEVPLV